jgi:hypothetical protein
MFLSSPDEETFVWLVELDVFVEFVVFVVVSGTVEFAVVLELEFMESLAFSVALLELMVSRSSPSVVFVVIFPDTLADAFVSLLLVVRIVVVVVDFVVVAPPLPSELSSSPESEVSACLTYNVIVVESAGTLQLSSVMSPDTSEQPYLSSWFSPFSCAESKLKPEQSEIDKHTFLPASTVGESP